MVMTIWCHHRFSNCCRLMSVDFSGQRICDTVSIKRVDSLVSGVGSSTRCDVTYVVYSYTHSESGGL